MSEQQIKPKSRGKNLFQLFKDSLADDDADIAEIGRQLRENREGHSSPSPSVQPEQVGTPQVNDSIGRHVGTSTPQHHDQNPPQSSNHSLSTSDTVNDSAGQHLDDSVTQQPQVDESTHEVSKSTPQLNYSATQVTNSASRQLTHSRTTSGRHLNDSASRQVGASAIPSDISELCITHREILQVAATVADGKINYREMSEWTGIAQGTCRDAMIRLRNKKILDFRPASKGRWRGITIEFTALGLEFLRKNQLLSKSAPQLLNESASQSVNRSASQQVDGLNKIDRSSRKDLSIKETQNFIDDDFIRDLCPIQWKNGLRVDMDKYQEAMKIWRQRDLDFSRLGRTLEILEDRYRRDLKIANPAEYTCHTLRTSGYATPLSGYISPEDQFEQTLAQADEREKALKEKLDGLIYLQFQTWLVEHTNEMEEHDTTIMNRLESWAKKRFEKDLPFRQLKRLEYFRKNVLHLYSKEYVEAAGEEEAKGAN